jgi:hypothetical protein
VFPNLALPTVAGLTPPSREVVLCDENIEPVDFDTDADVVGITDFVVHKRRMLELAQVFRLQPSASASDTTQRALPHDLQALRV